MGAQRSLFEIATMVERDWRPQLPPSLAGVREIFLDVESDGLRWWGRDRPVGIAVAFGDGRSRYLPFRHAGGNLDEEHVKTWARRELRDIVVKGFNLPFDVNMMYAWGVDLEAQGCTLQDLGNHAALLDDNRRSTSLDSVSRDYLGFGKIQGIDTSCMTSYHAGDVNEYACRDVLLCVELDQKFKPMLRAEGLETVRQLEDDLVYVTCEMMRNGAPLDEEKLDRWIASSEKDYVAALWEVHRLTGLTINVRSRPDMLHLFEHLKIPPPTSSDPDEFGKITFTRAKMRSVDHPVVALVNKARALASLRSKFLLKYKEELRKYGILRYSLHQMPMDDEGGARSGRYSSSSFGTTDPEDGVNIQQVAGKKQLQSVGEDTEMAGYVVRELFLPGSGLWLSADAAQIEYRLFADYAKPPKVMEAYARDPRTDFHNIVMNDMIRPVFPTVTRERTKDTNFAKIYGAQLKKIALMLGISEAEARRFIKVYDRAFPEAEQLLQYASRLAETRGFVKTKLGRRRRFLPGAQTYAALNGVIQGSAADEMKTKALMLHRARRTTGLKMRFLVHDEVNGDVPDKAAAERVSVILNTPVLKTTVPLLWVVGTGRNWREAKEAA